MLLIANAVEPAVNERYKSGFVYLLIYFFAITTLSLHFMLQRFSRGNPKRFISYFMAATGLKLFLYLAVLLAFVFSFPNDAVGFIIEFFILYLLYTSYEVYFILKLKHKGN